MNYFSKCFINELYLLCIPNNNSTLYYKNYGTYNVKNSFVTINSCLIIDSNGAENVLYNCNTFPDLTEIRKCI